MKNVIYNPYLPEYEYIPDGEPHVFGDRVYIYGSHDRFQGKKFCMNHYVCYSADVSDLTKWDYEGVIYRNDQDPRMTNGDHQLWAPDVVQGKDGRYYLYYCPDDKILSIGVAVCDSPAGKYEFYGIVKDKDGRPIGEREGDTYSFDPGVFIDDDGRIFLYSGNGPRTKGAIGKQPKASKVMELEEDMITIKVEPRKLLPTLGEAKGTGFEGHEFFEASSIRKIDGRYYLVYSSVALHELCYAVSDKPDEGFQYGGVVVSNADHFESDPNPRMYNCYGNNHGGIECINGEYYIFYHRQTNRSMFSRQGCAERIKIAPDGSIAQVELTSQGLYGKPLPAEGTYPASMACRLYGKREPEISFGMLMRKKHPYLTQDGEDFEPEKHRLSDGTIDLTLAPRQYVKNCKDGLQAVYKYFEANHINTMSVRVRGKMNGQLLVFAQNDKVKKKIGQIMLSSSKEWKNFVGNVELPEGRFALIFHYCGNGRFDFLEFSFE
ncbi:MAG: family 43 glycosylhydrolase [Eubacteriales bacterium]|nr:family 43 glycosylhydrolase [Eubacteriales bacterium]